MKRQSHKTILILFVTFATILACNMPSQATPTEAPVVEPSATLISPVIETPVPPPTEIGIQHTIIPANLPENRSSHAGDYDSSATADEKKSNGGDRFTFERFERPFNANTMDIYYPELDIVDTFVFQDETWLYGTIKVVDRAAVNMSPYRFAMQLDTDVNGKGNYLVVALNPSSTEWTTDGVQVYQDANRDVGNLTAMVSDKGAPGGDGFEANLFDNGKGNDPDSAWIRESPNDANTVEIAVKRALVGNPPLYMVDMWAGHGNLDPSLFDFSDHYTHDQAGAADPGLPNFYPIKSVFELDNSCRMAVGFEPNGSEPGLCPFIAPPKAEGGETPTSCAPSMTELNSCMQFGGTWNYATCRCDIPVIP